MTSGGVAVCDCCGKRDVTETVRTCAGADGSNPHDARWCVDCIDQTFPIFD